MAKAPKLEVYCTPVGFYDALVAAPSQKAALKAWGTTTHLFAAGRASVVEDPQKLAQALARPGEVIKTPRGGADEILADIDHDESARSLPKQRPKAARTKAPAPDRSELDGAERAIADAERSLADHLDIIAAERAELEQREAAIRKEGELKLIELGRTRDRMRAAYERALHRSRSRV